MILDEVLWRQVEKLFLQPANTPKLPRALPSRFSGGWILAVIRAASQAGFFVRLIYVCVDSPERNIQRVRERVAQGGHDVPGEDIRRRYARSLENVAGVLANLNEAILFDNSEAEPRKVLEMRSGAIIFSDFGNALWAKALIENYNERPS